MSRARGTRGGGASSSAEWIPLTARRVDENAGLHPLGFQGRFGPSQERWLRKMLAATAPLEAQAALRAERHAARPDIFSNAQWTELARAAADWVHYNLSIQPAGFEPTRYTRIIEGRPVQARGPSVVLAGSGGWPLVGTRAGGEGRRARADGRAGLRACGWRSRTRLGRAPRRRPGSGRAVAQAGRPRRGLAGWPGGQGDQRRPARAAWARVEMVRRRCCSLTSQRQRTRGFPIWASA